VAEATTGRSTAAALERPTPPAGRNRTPSGRELQSLLQEGIAGLGQLQSAPFGDPAPRRGGAQGGAAGTTRAASPPAAVRTGAAAFTGRAALVRAREIRDALRRRGAPADPLLDELFELLDRIGADAELS
jgi:hypothetical protein